MKGIHIIIFSIFAMTGFNAQAQSYGYGYAYTQPYGHYPDYNQKSPAQLLEMGVHVLQNYLQSKQPGSTEKVVNFLDSQLAPFFDFEQMARWTAGFHYNRMNSAQRYIFQSNLKKLFFSAFARIINAYGEAQPRIVFLPPRHQGYDEVIVTARVMPSNSYPIRIDFRFLKGPTGWKIYDVGTNGSSAVAYYRAYFNNLIRTRGVNALLQQ